MGFSQRGATPIARQVPAQAGSEDVDCSYGTSLPPRNSPTFPTSGRARHRHLALRTADVPFMCPACYVAHSVVTFDLARANASFDTEFIA